MDQALVSMQTAQSMSIILDKSVPVSQAEPHNLALHFCTLTVAH